MKIIDGKKIAMEVENRLKDEIIKSDLTPGLAIILIGNNDASEIYVRNKMKKATDIGINAKLYRFDETSREEEILRTIDNLNNDINIHGIIIQSPIPQNFNYEKLVNRVVPTKDIDGFGIFNTGALATTTPYFMAATPKGILKMLEYENINLKGAYVVIVGRSNIVGKPLALALLNKDATVTVTHSKTKNLKDITSKADILVVAVGKPRFITSEYVKDGSVVIDVGINRVDAKIIGDVDASVQNKASYMTLVPGGVGPMTIAMLLENVVESAKKDIGR